MPIVPFESLPDSARVWVFGADRPVRGEAAERLLAEVDRYLAGWRAHGEPLTVARDWRADHFLTVAVDQTDAHASGCSIDGLFRTLGALEQRIGASLVGGGRVYWRRGDGGVRVGDRGDFARVAAEEGIGGDTRVFDPTVTTLGDWRARFDTTVQESWHAQLLGA
jgi:hypothetical protein